MESNSPEMETANMEMYVNQKMEELLTRCRNAGMNVTPQRLAVYRALLEAKDHPSPEMLYNRVRASMPSLSLATIYKALDALAKLGMVRELSAISEAKRFEANLAPHQHMICVHCKKVEDLWDERLNHFMTTELQTGGFVPWTIDIQIVGECSTCARPQA